MVPGAVALGGVAVSLALGCQQPQAFQCEVAADCVSAGADGVCEANGFCSFPDMRCPSGRAFGEFAEQSLAGQCVEPDAAGGDTEGAVHETTGTTTGVSASATGATLPSEHEETSDDSSSSTSSAIDEGENSSSDGGDEESTAAAGCEWWDTDWRRRVTVSYPAGATSESLLEFPLFLRLNASRLDTAYAGHEGVALRIVDPITGEVVPHVIHEWDPNGWSAVWARVPQLNPNGGTFDLYYDNGNADDVNDESEVFFGAFDGVAHNDLSAQLLHPTGPELCSLGDTEPGFVGHAASAGEFCFQSVMGGTALSLEQRGTASLWVRRDEVFATDQGLAQYGLGGKTGPVRWTLILNGGQEPELLFRHLGSGGTEGEWSATLPNWDPQDWHHITVTHAAQDDVQIYFDGQPVAATQQIVAGALSTIETASPFAFGKAGEAGDLEGIVDEFRYTSTARSAAWIGTEYASDNDELLNYGLEELYEDCAAVAG